MAVGDMGKKAIQFGKNVAFGIRGSSIGYAEGIGIRKLQANMSKEQKQRIAAMGKKAQQIALKGGKTAKEANAQSLKVRRRLSEDAILKDTMGYKIGDFLGSGVRNVYKNKQAGMRLEHAAKGAFTRNARDKSGKLIRDDAGNIVRELNTKAIAGTAVTAGMAARIASGGGLYRDRNGDTNIPVIPFI